MQIVVLTPPPVEPVTAGEAFFHLKLITDAQADVTEEPEYAEVMRCVTAAREQCEQYTRRAFVQQTLLLQRGPEKNSERRGLEWYMNGAAGCWGTLELLRPPLVSVTAVRFYDEDNVLQTIDEESYFVQAGLVPSLRFVTGFNFPSTYLRSDAIEVEYVAGYPVVAADPEADPPTLIDYRANLPASIKSAILLTVQALYDKLLPADHEKIMNARDALLSSYRVHTL